MSVSKHVFHSLFFLSLLPSFILCQRPQPSIFHLCHWDYCASLLNSPLSYALWSIFTPKQRKLIHSLPIVYRMHYQARHGGTHL
jgi:hypothetical protein